MDMQLSSVLSPGAKYANAGRLKYLLEILTIIMLLHGLLLSTKSVQAACKY